MWIQNLWCDWAATSRPYLRFCRGASGRARHFKSISHEALTLRSDDQKGFQVVPWRWVVERTFAWLGAYRRLSKDFEFWCEHSESMIYIASIHRLLKSLAPPT